MADFAVPLDLVVVDVRAQGVLVGVDRVLESPHADHQFVKPLVVEDQQQLLGAVEHLRLEQTEEQHLLVLVEEAVLGQSSRTLSSSRISKKSLASDRWNIGEITWWYFLNSDTKLLLLRRPFWEAVIFLISSQIFLKGSMDSIWVKREYQDVCFRSHFLDVVIRDLVFCVERRQHACADAEVAVDRHVVHRPWHALAVLHDQILTPAVNYLWTLLAT